MKSLDKFITESLIINEAFKSQVLRDIATYVKGHAEQFDAKKLGDALNGHGNDRLVFPRGIQWDKLTDDDIVFGFSNDDLIRKSIVIKDKDWIVLWIHTRLLYTYMSCNGKAYKLNVSANKKFYRNQTVSMFKNGDDTVFTGPAALFDPSKGFYTKKEVNFDNELMSNYGDPFFVIAIPKKTILKLSTLNLIKSRYEARKGATAFMTDDDIRKKNLQRYDDELAKIHSQNKNAKTYVQKAVRLVTEYRKMLAEFEEAKKIIDDFGNERISDILKGAGVDDEGYMELFMGINNLDDDTLLNGKTKDGKDWSASWEIQKAESTLNSAKSIIIDAMNKIKEINSAIKYAPLSQSDLQTQFEGWNIEFNRYQTDLADKHSDMTNRINNFKNYLR